MNYIKHFNGALQQFSGDSRLNPTHISLYIALFQLWNIYRFPEVFYIDREEVMKLSKIGSKATYHKCLRNLNDWKYIEYLPSHNPYKGSEIRMFIFDTSVELAVNNYETSDEQALVSNTNMTKHKKNKNKQAMPEDYFEVLVFFKKENQPETEALHFFNYYQSKAWKVGDNVEMKDWKAVAKCWIRKSEPSRFFDDSPRTPDRDNLKTNKTKDYGQPL